MKVLWLSPNLNHYKAGFLTHLANQPEIELTVLAGTGRKGKGDKNIETEPNFELKRVNVSKAKFGFSQIVRKELRNYFMEFDWVMIPREKKNLLLFLYALRQKKNAHLKGKEVKLLTYNHPILKSGPGRITLIDKFLTRFYYKYYDRVIFYTKKSCREMIQRGYIKPEKAFWANNTLDTVEISKHYKFSYPNPSEPTILFIGRLVSKKRIDLLLNYYFELKDQIDAEKEQLKMIIIGDGPKNNLVKKAIEKDASIEWAGSLVEEQKIMPHMQRASLVFIPGHSGLSINHAFCYGRPYITLAYSGHPPEIDYIEEGYNGYILNGNHSENINFLKQFLLTYNPKIYDNAFQSGKMLSVENWCAQIVKTLTN